MSRTHRQYNRHPYRKERKEWRKRNYRRFRARLRAWIQCARQAEPARPDPRPPRTSGWLTW